MDPWRYSTQGISVALRVTPRGGRDEIDGLETLANGRTVLCSTKNKQDLRQTSSGGLFVPSRQQNSLRGQ